MRRLWKTKRESKLSGEYRSALAAVTAEAFQAALEQALESRPDPAAVVTVELRAACVREDGGPFMIPAHGLSNFLKDNPHTSFGGLVATAANTGQLPVDIRSFSLRTHPADGGLAGEGQPAKHFSGRLEVGSAVDWIWDDATVEQMLASFIMANHAVFDVYATVDLATGSMAESEKVGIEHLPFWTGTMADEIAEMRQRHANEHGDDLPPN